MRLVQCLLCTVLATLCAASAFGSPVFNLAATHLTDDYWSYKLDNNSTSGERAVALMLHWSTDTDADVTMAAANFDQYSGYIATPDTWMRESGSFPFIGVIYEYLYSLPPGQSVSGLELHYGTVNNLKPTPPTYYQVTYLDASTHRMTSLVQLDHSVNEPGNLLVAVAGLALLGLRGAFHRKDSD